MSKSTHARLGDFPEPPARRARGCDRDHERPIRVAICDDHPLVVHGVSAFLGRQRAIHVVGTASDGDGAVALAVSQSPDVLLLDLIMPRVSGFEAARTILAMNAPVRILALTGYEGPGHLERLLDAGMAGCLLKRADLSQLVIAIYVVAAGGVYVDPLLVSRVVTTTSDVDDLGRCVDRLTPREAAVVRLLALGWRNKAIAAELALSTKTVETHRAHAMRKLGARERSELVRYAFERGWLEELRTPADEVAGSSPSAADSIVG